MATLRVSDGLATAPREASVPVATRGAGSLGIGASGLAKRYGTFTALDNVSLDVGAGEFLTLLGPSGSGKTTLLNIIAGFVLPDAGQLRFGTEDVTLTPVNRRGLGMVFQNYALFPHMSVAENVAFALKVRRLGPAEVQQRVARVLELVQLGHLGDRRVSQLSGGQKQRVALARAVVFSPRIVLMDEPLSALDKNLREAMQVEIRHLHEQIGATTVYVTHDQREALTMSDRIAVMNQGRMVQCGTPEDIYERPVNAFVAGFIGETTLVDVAPAPGGVLLADGTLLRTPAPIPSGELRLALRAERLLMPDECPHDVNRLPCVVREVIYQGDSALVLADIVGDTRIAVRRPLRGARMADQPRAGEFLQLGLERSATLVVRA
ncbi:MAG: polyamine ABC transporter ATP-binding protein [Variovorax paradoxus]|uniref:Polyamine ABC transporter ATP-binding protein n=1 Tax=Variovorax paradoxus TaxID=34073 RepID=A0A2W5QBX8_VARPD|nr:MAG: polyamine ABC transporter ATP-binding protein [Variovorax paradoxus]